LKSNDVRIYPKNSAIVEAIDKNEISIGLTNHYYAWEIAEALGRPINVKNGFFSPGDLGNLINVSGAGVMLSSKKYSAAQDLINFLTSAAVQSDFVVKTNEYSLLPNSPSPADLPGLDAIGAPTVDLGTLRNIQRTQDLLVKVGLL
jgi:iron(III) transport system substrate-binding protein